MSQRTSMIQRQAQAFIAGGITFQAFAKALEIFSHSMDATDARVIADAIKRVQS